MTRVSLTLTCCSMQAACFEAGQVLLYAARCPAEPDQVGRLPITRHEPFQISSIPRLDLLIKDDLDLMSWILTLRLSLSMHERHHCNASMTSSRDGALRRA
jgi:hypothetical protein